MTQETFSLPLASFKGDASDARMLLSLMADVVDQLNSYASGKSQKFAVTGAIEAYGGTAAPDGWLLCNGAAVSRTTYAALFAVVGVAFGVGDNSTTFNLPDLRGRFPIGKAASGTGSTLGGTGGTIDHTHKVTPNSVNAATPGTPLAVGAATEATTDAGNPPFQAVNYIIKT